MNSPRLQDTRLIYRNLLHFFTLTVKYQKRKVLKIPYKITEKIVKYLGINLTKKVKDLYGEIYKTLIKEIEDDLKNGKISISLLLEELILLKWSYSPKQYTDLMQSLSICP